MNNRYLNFLTSLKVLFRIFFLGVLILFISRVVFLLAFGDYNDLKGYIPDILRAFVMGFRFDAKILAFSLLPLVILCLLQFLNYHKIKVHSFFHRFSLIYGLILMLVIVIISAIDFYFFKFFHTRISVLFFGIIEDDTTAVLKSVWTDYPIILIFASLIAISVLLYFVLRKLIRIEVKHYFIQSSWLRLVLVILFLGVCFLALRGSLRMKPLDARYATISSNTFVNTLTQNGVFSLKTAFSDRKDTKISTDINQMLGLLDFKKPEEAISAYLGRKDIDTTSLTSNLLSTTPKDSLLESNHPNVVFIFMESMSNYYLDLHTAETNLLGKLEDQLKDCYVFRNFLSSTSGTIYSLESVLIGTPNSPLSQSMYQNRSLSTSVAKPFHDQGYATSFVTGGSLGWRNLDKFIYHQYFDAVEGESNLKELYPNASVCEWGVQDEFIFDRMYQILSKDVSKPKFIFSFTISNHTPYDIPESYKGYPLVVTEDIKSRLKTTSDIAYKNLMAYQYANNCLGQFIENVRKSPFGDNTIIVATGDHNTLQLFEFADKDMLKKYSVPLILYVPDKYKSKDTVNTRRFGSHKDIFPTIFNLALSNATYLNTGNSMLSKDSLSGFGIYNYHVAMSSAGCVDFQNITLNYSWEDNSFINLIPLGTSQVSSLDSLCLKAKAYKASMNYYIMSELKSKKVGEK